MTKLSGPGSASWAWAHDGVYSWSLSPGTDSQVLAASVASEGGICPSRRLTVLSLPDVQCLPLPLLSLVQCVSSSQEWGGGGFEKQHLISENPKHADLKPQVPWASRATFFRFSPILLF